MKVIYTIYLKNSVIIKEEVKIDSYYTYDEAKWKEKIENFMALVQEQICIYNSITRVKEKGTGSLKFGNTIVNISEVAAVTFKIVEKELTGIVSGGIKVETLLL